MKKVKLVRGNNRIIGGVCQSIGERYKIEPILLRVAFVVSLFFINISIFIYLILWNTIPNERKINLKKGTQIRTQILGSVIGSLLGVVFLGGVAYLTMELLNDSSGFLGVIILAIYGFPLGAVLGFSVVKLIMEKKSFNDLNEL
ncbi:PspC domain-containing protein [Aureivirga sp. CE67]|uniref:PspC domain-containing protein n=1 Tax=Aureivirga sp. CE67 TaxID=1788983 RepID=UPI0018CAD4E6|nr:PspC domain-containing protein [Aureivirga sp. CE67]